MENITILQYAGITHEIQFNPKWPPSSVEDITYDILPNGAKAAFISSVVISGLRSPTKTWKWSYQEKEKKYTFLQSDPGNLGDFFFKEKFI